MFSSREVFLGSDPTPFVADTLSILSKVKSLMHLCKNAFLCSGSLQLAESLLNCWDPSRHALF